MIAYIEGKVLLDNQEIEADGPHFPDMKEASVLRTKEGRAEILPAQGYVLRLGENGSLRLLASRLADTRLELLSGSAVVEVNTA